MLFQNNSLSIIKYLNGSFSLIYGHNQQPQGISLFIKIVPLTYHIPHRKNNTKLLKIFNYDF